MASLRLSDALQKYRRESDSPSNAYDWYRSLAQRSGRVHFGSSYTRAWKEHGAWYVDAEEFEAAMKHLREDRARLRKRSRDLEAGIIHGKDGDAVTTADGGYELRGAFRFVWSNRQRAYRDCGTWYCNTCNRM